MKKLSFVILMLVFFAASPALLISAEIDDRQSSQISDLYGKVDSLKKDAAKTADKIAQLQEAAAVKEAQTGTSAGEGKEAQESVFDFGLEMKLSGYAKTPGEVEGELVFTTGGFELGITPVYEIGGSKMITEIEYAASYGYELWLLTLSPGYAYILTPDPDGNTDEDGKVMEVKEQEYNFSVSADVVGSPEINYIYKPEASEGVVELTVSHSVNAGPVELSAEAMFESVFNADYRGFTVCEAVIAAAIPLTDDIGAAVTAEKCFALNGDVAQEEDVFFGLELTFKIK